MSEEKETKEAKPINGRVSQLKKKDLPRLGALEDDDEFPDFPPDKHLMDNGNNINDTLMKVGAGPQDNWWEDSWDDDDVAEDFAKQLRTAIQERANAPADKAMKE
nr:26S proteasome complex subunit DSS1 [Cryptococcus depauperatus CBS 7841]ODN92334.1 26S proteasome complex subunit DSS1 [Cryptococcus depauperatus CBS 7855]